MTLPLRQSVWQTSPMAQRMLRLLQARGGRGGHRGDLQRSGGSGALADPGSTCHSVLTMALPCQPLHATWARHRARWGLSTPKSSPQPMSGGSWRISALASPPPGHILHRLSQSLLDGAQCPQCHSPLRAPRSPSFLGPLPTSAAWGGRTPRDTHLCSGSASTKPELSPWPRISL